MKFILSLMRTVLGWIIKFFDRITRPSPMERSRAEQKKVEDELENLAVYEFDG